MVQHCIHEDQNRFPQTAAVGNT